jgi:UDP-glucose 4-epimerase
VGQALCVHLKAQGFFVRAWLRTASVGPWDESVIGDLVCDHDQKEIFNTALHDIDTVFHLAGIAHTEHAAIEDYWLLNVNATQQLLDAAAQANISRFIYFSSVKAIHPDSAYGQSKQAAQNLVLAQGSKTNMHTCILQPALVYGPGLKGNLLNLLKAIDRHRFPPIPETHNQRSLVSLKDLVEVAVLVAADPRANAKTYVVTDGIAYSTRQIVDAFRGALGLTPLQWSLPLGVLRAVASIGDSVDLLKPGLWPMNTATLDKLLGSAFYSAADLSQTLGWQPSSDLWRELPAIVAAYRKNPL